jgi:hypothetical protein
LARFKFSQSQRRSIDSYKGRNRPLGESAHQLPIIPAVSDPQNDNRVLIEQCLADGVDGVRQLVGDASGLATILRERDLGRANYGLVRLARDLKALVVLVQGMREPLATIRPAASLPTDDDIETLVSSVESLIAAQMRADWLTMADYLEYDLATELHVWGERFESARQACAA